MAWGSDTAATQLTGITTEQFFNQVPTLNPRENGARAGVGRLPSFPDPPRDHRCVHHARAITRAISSAPAGEAADQYSNDQERVLLDAAASGERQQPACVGVVAALPLACRAVRIEVTTSHGGQVPLYARQMSGLTPRFGRAEAKEGGT
jgi:hypothetical protein